MGFSYQINEVWVSPCLIPPPESWWFGSFQYYQAFPLIQGKIYGPFFRIGGEDFRPIIGVLGDYDSETHCFYALYRPINAAEARRAYNLPENNPCSHVHQFCLTIPERCNDAIIYIGPARDGMSLQVGINGRVAELINEVIEKGNVSKSSLSLK